jgi:hypothetical protein
VTDWNLAFATAHLHSWPTASLTISKAAPGGRSLWDDRVQIQAAAKQHGYSVLLENKKIISYIRRSA